MNEAEQEKTPAQGIWCGKMCPELSAPTKEPILASCSKKPQKWPANKPPLFLSLKTDGQHPDASPIWEDNGALRGEYLMHSFGGVPQRRKRIALVADFGGLTAPEILFERQGVPGYIKPCGKERQGAAGNTENGTNPTSPAGGAYCIQGNCIDRADTAGCNGKGWTEGVSYTLNTIDRPAVLPFVPSPPKNSEDVVVFEPGSCSRVGGHIWQDGKAPSLRAEAGDNQPAVVLEHHPNDSRLKIAEDGVVQTLNARMGTGGGNVPLVMCSIPDFGI